MNIKPGILSKEIFSIVFQNKQEQNLIQGTYTYPTFFAGNAEGIHLIFYSWSSPTTGSTTYNFKN